MTSSNGSIRTTDNWTHGGADRAAMISSTFTATVRDDVHVAINRQGDDPTRRSVHIGLYDLHNVTLYASDKALELIRDTITAHLEVVATGGELGPCGCPVQLVRDTGAHQEGCSVVVGEAVGPITAVRSSADELQAAAAQASAGARRLLEQRRAAQAAADAQRAAQ